MAVMATPTPVKSRRGRAKKAASPVCRLPNHSFARNNRIIIFSNVFTSLIQESAQKEEAIANPGSLRTRRTLKSVDLPAPEIFAPPSSTR